MADLRTDSPAHRIVLVGIAGYGSLYLSELLKPEKPLDGALVAVVEAFPERSTQLGELQARRIPVFPDLESFYARDQADLVIIAAPIHLHEPLTRLALAKGSHVLCEKPLCATAEEGQRIIRAQEESGKIVSIGYQWSFSPAIGLLKEDILSGLLGKPLEMKTLVLWPRRHSYYHRNSWAGTVKAPGGQWVFDSPLNNATAHFLHNMLYLLGDRTDTSALPSRIQAELFRANDIENFDTAAVMVHTEAGVPLRMYASHAVRDYQPPLFRLRFENALVEAGEDQVIRGHFADGSVKVFGNPDDCYFNKLHCTLEAIRDRASGKLGTVPCGPRAAFSQTLCIQGIQDFTIQPFPKVRLRLDPGKDDPLVWVEGLAEEYIQRYASDVF